VEVTAHRRAGAGELVAYELPAGPIWLDIVRAHASSGASLLPIDPRLSAPEKRRLLGRAAPTVVVTPDGETLFPGQANVDPQTAWIVIATSGTGGEPRLVELGRPAVGTAVTGSLDALGISASDPWVACLPPAHIGGLLVLLRGVLADAPLVIHERSDPDRLLAEAPMGAHVAMVPTMLVRLVAREVRLDAFGVLLVGGAALDPGLRDAATRLGARVVSTYGLTESCGGVAYDGVPFAGSEARVDDADAVQLRGPTLMDGYLADPQATAEAFTTDGWLRTQDLGSIAGGRLVVDGRADDAIRTGGETVWPAEVERVLRSLPGIADVAVAGVADEEWGQRVVAWVVPVDPNEPPVLDEIRAGAREHLASFKVPRDIRFVDELPRTASGKVRRSALR